MVGVLAAILSTFAVVCCLVVVPTVVFKLGTLKLRVEKEMATFKVPIDKIIIAQFEESRLM